MLDAELLVGRVDAVGKRRHVRLGAVKQAAGFEPAGDRAHRRLHVAKMFEDADQQDEVEGLLPAGQLRQSRRAHFHAVQPSGGWGARRRRIDAQYVPESALFENRQEPARGAADVEDASLAGRQKRNELIRDGLESLEVIRRFRPLGMIVSVFRLPGIVTVQFFLRRDALGKTRAALPAHDDIVAIAERPIPKPLPVQHAALNAAADGTGSSFRHGDQWPQKGA